MLSKTVLGKTVLGKTVLGKIARLFVIKTRIEAYLVIFALATGAVQRGQVYLVQYPGIGGQMLFVACGGSVMMAGGKVLDCLRHEAKAKRAMQRIVAE